MRNFARLIRIDWHIDTELLLWQRQEMRMCEHEGRALLKCLPGRSLKFPHYFYFRPRRDFVTSLIYNWLLMNPPANFSDNYLI